MQPKNLSKNEICSCESWARKNRVDRFANAIRSKMGAHRLLCLNNLLDQYTRFIDHSEVQQAFQLAYPLDGQENDLMTHLDQITVDIESFLAKDTINVLGQYIQWCQRHNLKPTPWDYKLAEHVHRDTTRNIGDSYLAFYYTLHIWTNTSWRKEFSVDKVLQTKFPWEAAKTLNTVIGNLQLEKIESIEPKFLQNFLKYKKKKSLYINIENEEFIREALSVLFSTSIKDLEKYGYTDDILQNIYTEHMGDIKYSKLMWAIYLQKTPIQQLAISDWHWFSQLCLYEAFQNRPEYLKQDERHNMFERILKRNLTEKYQKQWHIWQIYQSVEVEDACLKTFSTVMTKMDYLELDSQILTLNSV